MISTSTSSDSGCDVNSSSTRALPHNREVWSIISRQQPYSSRLIDAIRINRLTPCEKQGVIYWVKQRRFSSRLIIPCANAFFRFAGNPVVVWTQPSAWQRWEIDSFELLHQAEGYRAFAGENGTVWAAQLPGDELETPAKANRITPGMLAAAARELRRAHSLPCPALGGEGWSHGDAHLANFIYDSTTDRARLIDFEVAHQAGMSTPDRHADDLFVMIQSTMGYWPPAPWMENARLLLLTYLEAMPGSQRADLLRRIEARLASPTGISRVWWAIRTDYLPEQERNEKITALRALIQSELKHASH